MPETAAARTAPHNRIAIVTGAGTGIGKAAALALLNAGWRVAFAGRRAEPLQAAIAAAGDPFGDIAERTLAVPTDVADPASVKALFDTVVARFGRVDLLFNNAGISASGFTLDELRGFLADRLGRHELPAALEIRDELPKSPAGKLLASALRAEQGAS